MFYKNTASQKIAVFAYNSSTGAPVTGDAANITAQISLDGGTSAATNDTNPTELDATDHPGIYLFDATQAESNANLINLSAVSSTGSVLLEPVIIYTDTGLKPLYTGSVTSGSATTYVMSGVTAANDDLNGYRLRITSGAMSGQCRMIKDWISSSSTLELDVAFSTALSAADTFVIEPAQVNLKHVNDLAATGVDLSTDLTEILDRLGFILAREAGAVPNAQTTAPQYSITRSGDTFTVTLGGCTSAGVRTAPTLNKT